MRMYLLLFTLFLALLFGCQRRYGHLTGHTRPVKRSVSHTFSHVQEDAQLTYKTIRTFLKDTLHHPEFQNAPHPIASQFHRTSPSDRKVTQILKEVVKTIQQPGRVVKERALSDLPVPQQKSNMGWSSILLIILIAALLFVLIGLGRSSWNFIGPTVCIILIAVVGVAVLIGVIAAS